MTADRTKTGPDASKGPPGGASSERPLDPNPSDSQDDIKFKRSMADFSRRLGEWTAQQPAADSGAAKDARRAALHEYDLARRRRLKSSLSLAASGAASACIAYLIVMIASPSDRPPLPAATASAASARPIETVTVVPMPPAKPPAAPTVEATAATASAVPDSPPAPALASAPPPPVESTPTTASAPPPVQPATADAPLRRDEVREVQTLLRSFGFDPGPVDGNAGRMTEAAVARYQRHRGEVQTGTVDRQLLEQLRQDPAPQVARRPTRPARAPAVPRTRRSNDPFEPVRAAGDRIGRWLESVMR